MANSGWLASLRALYGPVHLVCGPTLPPGSTWADAPQRTACGLLCSAPPPDAAEGSAGADVRRGLALTTSAELCEAKGWACQCEHV